MLITRKSKYLAKELRLHVDRIIRTRQTSHALPRMFVNSIPKSGTNLLIRGLQLFPDIYYARHFLSATYNRITSDKYFMRWLKDTREGEFFAGHIFYSEKDKKLFEDYGYKTLLMIRDPRDVVISHAYWVLNYEKHRLRQYYKSLSSINECFETSIRGCPGDKANDGKPYEGIKAWLNHFLPWTKEKINLTVKFEDLIGPAGGGEKNKQVKTINALAQHIGIELSNQQTENIAANIYHKGSNTFRKGQIADWPNHFDEKMKTLFKDISGEALIHMGYENDFDW